MIHALGPVTVKTLGDPHLGRRFLSGVPLHRRGEREASVWRQFAAELDDVGGVDVHVCLGDLFNAFVVPPEVTLEAAQRYRDAARRHPHVQYVVLMGNHDGARDAARRSSFDLFAALTAGVANLHVVSGAALALDGLLFCPWHPFQSAAELLAPHAGRRVHAAFGHWDLDAFGDEPPHNLLPWAELAALTGRAFTGHVHKPGTRAANGLEVTVTGSMQPYAHGEEAEPAWYLTLTLDELLARPAEELRDRCLRLRLRPGEVPPEVDCLQLTVQRVTSDQEPLEVKLESFDLQKLFTEAFEEEMVEVTIAREIWSRFAALRNDTSAA